MDFKSYTLSGSWTIVKEDDGKGLDLCSAIPNIQSYTLPVPHQYDQSKWKLDYASSKAISRFHGYVWYYKSFEAMPKLQNGQRYRLEFDRVSYICQVYLNGIFIGEHCHSEERFSFDVTDSIANDKENLIAVRCFEPVCGCEPIDGISLDKIPNGFWAGSENHPNLFPIDSAGGILEDVRISVVPDVRIDDVFILPHPSTGEVSVEITVINDTHDARDIDISIRFSDTKHGRTLTEISGRHNAVSGKSLITLEAAIPNHKLWELNNPTLYNAEIRTSVGSSKSLRFGFKELVVKDGFFFLNGKRFILKCAHGTPSARTVIEMKTMGFNAFRSIQQVVPEEVLDLCDELGFLIIESPLTSWGMRYHENTKAMVESSLSNMVRMHRNHVCIGAFYLFNELKRREILHTGSDHLPALRAISPNNLFLLSSGRWDLEYDLGSISNPYSDKWECLLGNEGDADGCDHNYPSRFHVIHNLGMGDLHPYVYIPMDSEARNWFRTVGKDSRPVFISECGIGTHEHAMRCYFERLDLGSAPDSDTINDIKKVIDDMESFISHYGMEEVYPFVNDICRDADRRNGRQRQILFDLIRSNPKVSAFSLTSWGGGNEGTLEGNGVIKESVAYAMQEGWAPLRWALFTDERVMYADRPFSVEAVLCNEDILAPGKYRGQVAIKGSRGVVFREDFDALYPENGYMNMPPLAATVYKKTLSLPEDDYTFSIRLLEGGAPYGGQLRFSVVAPKKNDITANAPIATWGLSDGTLSYIRETGVDTSELDDLSECCTVLVGDPKNKDDKAIWERLFTLAEGGASIVFLNPEIFADESTAEYLKQIAGGAAKCESTIDWLYHFDSIHIRHPLFDRISDEGLLELEAFTELYPRLIFTGTRKADLTVCASLRVDAGCCATSLTVGEYNVGKGKIVINGFRIEESLGKNPYAEQMLINFLKHYAKQKT